MGQLRRLNAPARTQLNVALKVTLFACVPLGLLVGLTLGLVSVLNALIAIFFLLLLSQLDIPPYRLAPGIRWLIAGVGLWGVIYLDKVYGSSSIPIMAVLMIGCTISAVAYSAVIATHNFYRLQEIQPTAPMTFGSFAGRALATHVTDIHITEADDVGTVEDNECGGMSAFTGWLASSAVAKPRFLVVSGDVTDTGAMKEWTRAAKAIRTAALGNDQFLIVAPGNHDLFPWYGRDASYRGRLRRYFDFLRQVSPEMRTATSKLVRELAAQAEPEIEPHIDAKAKDDSFRKKESADPYNLDERWANNLKRDGIYLRPDWWGIAREAVLDDWYDSQWYELFPLTFYDKSTGTLVAVMNSVMRGAQTLGESALGEYGWSQLERLRALISALPAKTRSVLVVTHHAPFRAPGDWRLFIPWAVTGLRRTKARIHEFCYLAHAVDESRMFLSMLCEAASLNQHARFVLFCGHRHSFASGWAGPALVIEGRALEGEQPEEILVQTRPSLTIWKRTLLHVEDDR